MLRSVENFLISRREDQIARRGASYYLYKNLDAWGFLFYFAEGGIRPSSPGMPSITDSWKEAEGGREKKCLAVIPRNGITEHLTEESEGNYRGDYFIPWQSLERLFITPSALIDIRATYDSVDGSKIQWNEFMNKVTVIKPGQLSFRAAFAKFLRRAQ